MTQAGVAVFTRNLRVRDNPVLAGAVRAGRVVPLFVEDRAIGATMHRSANRYGFLCQSLADLDRSLSERGARLIVRTGDWVDEVLSVAHEAGASEVHVSTDVSRYAVARLERLRRAAGRAGVEVVRHDAVTAVAPRVFGRPFLVFTPYYRRWVAEPLVPTARLPDRLEMPPVGSVPVPTARPPAPWTGGERAGIERLGAWARDSLARYDERRDDPAADATSRISPYLHFGCLSPREVAARLAARDGGGPFVRQVCWRDFFAQLLWWRPELAVEDVRPSRAAWLDDPEGLAAWKEGRTGFPLVDAGMRQLLAEGWMHNRVRMVVASFLTKDLGVDWRLGAAHFMEHLVDGDVASNQLSWQWVAGTGTDTNPFRVLSPLRQAQMHDPDGRYVARWVPEVGTSRYPEPIIDHREAVAAWRARLDAARRGRGAQPVGDGSTSRPSGPSAAGPPSSSPVTS